MRKTTKNQKSTKTSTRASRNTKTVVTPTVTKRNSKNAKTVTPVAPKTIYNAITKNIYFDGHSYRARVTIGGKCNSRNFSSKTAAIRWRNEVKRSIA